MRFLFAGLLALILSASAHGQPRQDIVNVAGTARNVPYF